MTEQAYHYQCLDCRGVFRATGIWPSKEPPLSMEEATALILAGRLVPAEPPSSREIATSLCEPCYLRRFTLVRDLVERGWPSRVEGGA